MPADLNWDAWLGVAAERPFLNGLLSPRRTGGSGSTSAPARSATWAATSSTPCSPSLALTAPKSVRSEGGAPNDDSWGLDSQVHYVFPGTKYTTDPLTLTWYDGDRRPPAEVKALIGERPLHDQGSIYIGTEGVLYSPYIAAPVLLPAEKFADYKLPSPAAENHYLQFVEACRGNGKTSTPFDYSGPLTEIGAARLPGDPLPRDDPGVGRGQPEGDQRRRGRPGSSGARTARAGRWKGSDSIGLTYRSVDARIAERRSCFCRASRVGRVLMLNRDGSSFGVNWRQARGVDTGRRDRPQDVRGHRVMPPRVLQDVDVDAAAAARLADLHGRPVGHRAGYPLGDLQCPSPRLVESALLRPGHQHVEARLPARLDHRLATRAVSCRASPRR